jgi:hypothetical protein
MAEQIGEGEVVARGGAGRLVIGEPASTSITRRQAGDRSITDFLQSFASRMTLLHR